MIVVIDLKKSGIPCEGYVGAYVSNSAFRGTNRPSVHIKKLNVKRCFARKETTSRCRRAVYTSRCDCAVCARKLFGARTPTDGVNTSLVRRKAMFLRADGGLANLSRVECARISDAYWYVCNAKYAFFSQSVTRGRNVGDPDDTLEGLIPSTNPLAPQSRPRTSQRLSTTTQLLCSPPTPRITLLMVA